MPGKPVFITEWGWDSDGAGENCVGDQYHSVCVSAYEQVSDAFAIHSIVFEH
jgi:hypothetical protein